MHVLEIMQDVKIGRIVASNDNFQKTKYIKEMIKNFMAKMRLNLAKTDP